MKSPPSQTSQGPVTRGRRQALSTISRTLDPCSSGGPSSTNGSNCGVSEFSKEEVEMLLKKRLRVTSRFITKEKLMSDHIRMLKRCIRWFQQLEGSYIAEQEKIRDLLEIAEKKCTDLDTRMKGKEEELGLIITELRKNYEALQGKFAKEEADKMTSQDEAMRQKEALTSEIQCLRGKFVAELNGLTAKNDDLERRCLSQGEIIRSLQKQLALAEEKVQISDMSAVEARAQFDAQTKIICDLQNELAEGVKLRKKMHNTILEVKGDIRVFCRVRPLLSNDAMEPEVISFPRSLESLGKAIDLTQNGQKHSFTFDKVFTPDALQEDVFVEISQLVQSALDGYKVCIFAYGQTGSGKTYTMMGKPGIPDQKGLIPRTLELVFETRQTLQLEGWKYDIKVSMLEIYNEAIRDLLSPNIASFNSPNKSSCSASRTAGKQHAIKHDTKGNAHVCDLTIVDVCSSKEVSYLLGRAAHSRSVGRTQMNEQSSRSHFVFTLRISGVNESTKQQVQGVLNLIDLAGSERLSRSGATGDRLKETQAINKSLSSLGDVMFALAKKEEHVPFRNSKLTYLLQPCLGGDSKTLMFVNVAPDISSAGESLCSLRFAGRVNACEIGIPRR